MAADAPHPEANGAGRGLSRLNDILRALLGVALIAVVFVNVVNATGRYVFGVSFLGADELMVYAVIWLVMAGAVLSLGLRSHINVNLLPSYARGRTKLLLFVVQDAAALFACSVAAYASWLFIGRIAKLGMSSMALGLPMTIPHAALLLGFGGMAMVAAVLLVRDAVGLSRLHESGSVG